MAKNKLISVTVTATGHNEVMTRQQFDKTFGKSEGKEILAGYDPTIVAVVVDTEKGQ